MTVSIETFRPEHLRRFAELNREWLLKYNLLEPADEEQLADPQTHFLDTGGQVFVALHDGRVILLSNSQLTPALHLYESLDFRFHPVP